jgi:MSHA pilin protein MshD
MAGTVFPRNRGFTLIEMVAFIVIVGVAAVALFTMFTRVVPRNPQPIQLEQATQLAQERMELILGRREASGYAAAELDPCKVGSPTICSSTLGFNVTSTGTTLGSEVAWNGNPTANFKLITVTVTLGGTTLGTANAVLANY